MTHAGGWDNRTEAQLAAMPWDHLKLRVLVYTVTSLDRKTKPDYPELDAALTRAIAVLKARPEYTHAV